jgi:hypothetical protein
VARHADDGGKVAMTEGKRPEDLSDEDRERLHRAHTRVRRASQGLEGLTAPEQLRGRWVPAAAPAEALDGARGEFDRAYAEVCRLMDELLDWSESEAPAIGDAT